MRKILAASVAALTFAGAVAATAPAEARPYGHYRYYHRHHDNDAGVAIAAGVVGLALGAALASDSGRSGYYNRGYYSRPYYDGYYGRPYYGGYGGYGAYDGGYAVCTSRRLVWDPYIRRRVEIVDRYAC